MIRFAAVVLLELRALLRSRTALLLMVAAAVWMLAVPHIVTGDGTAAGMRELTVGLSLGGVFTLLVVSLLASATGSFARERNAKRLQLTLVRPVSRVTLFFGKLFSHVLVGAVVWIFSCLLLLFMVDGSCRCRHVLAPILPSVKSEAREMYESYMADTNTPAEVRSASKSTVLRLLENRALDHYQTLPTNEVVSWRFSGRGDALRLRFSTSFDMREEVVGVFRSGSASSVVSNMTQAILEIPFAGAADEISFENRGSRPLMLRPRRDIQVLASADAFVWNLFRASMMVIGILALVVSFGLVLGSGLGRPVAMFVAFVTLLVGEMSPSVIEQYPNELDAGTVDKIGLWITRFAAAAVRPLSSESPLEALAKDECVEVGRVVGCVAIDLVIMPLLMSFLAALMLPRKQDDLGG